LALNGHLELLLTRTPEKDIDRVAAQLRRLPFQARRWLQGTMVQGEYTALVTRQAPAVQGAAAGSPGAASMATKQALIGTLPTPSFLANVK
jgi:hypothetical protein